MADNILKGIYAKKDGVKVKFDFPSGEGGNPFEGYLEVDSGASATGTQYKGVKMVNSGNNKAALDLNTKGNLTIKTYDNDEKGHINIEPQKNIQIKPGNNFIFDTSNIMLKGAGAKNRVDIRCEFGDYDDAHEGIGDWAGLPHGEHFDEEWAECVFNARNIDLRCNAHGGIALQPCGQDGGGKENKIKFESSRTSVINAPGAYSEEGGKGLEFGTFNNLHSSLYTGDYRFNGNAMVYGVHRGTPMVDPDGKGSSKFDYPTQADDFKDILPVNESGETTGATWNEIVRVARKYADGEISGGGEGGGVDLDTVKNWVNSQEFVKMEGVNEALVPVGQRIDKIDARLYRKTKNGNLEVTAEGLGKYAIDNDPTSEIIPAEAVLFENVEEYNAAKGTSLTVEEFNALTDDEKIKIPAVEADPASLDLVSEGKIAFKGTEISLEAGAFTIPVEISKKGKFTIGGVELPDKVKTMADVAAGITQCPTAFNLVMDKNNILDFTGATEAAEIAEAYPVGSIVGSISIGTLIGLVNRVGTLESQLSALEARVAALENPNEEEEPEVEPESGSTI